jgi:glycosyltransferase involved in cell wall biosynthesis
MTLGCLEAASAVTASVAHPTVVLGVPAYNEARFIRSTLESIRRQTHEDFAVLISDNASSDATEEICRELAGRDARFTYIRQRANIGAARNFDLLRQTTTSPYFAWIGGHDLLHPDYLAVHLRELARRPEVGVSFSCFDLIDHEDRTIQLGSNAGEPLPQSGRFLRYLSSVILGAGSGSIHGLFRRAAMSPLPIRVCPAWDLVFLSNSLYLAPFHAIPGHLYRLRRHEEKGRSQNHFERISGQPHAEFTDFREVIPVFLDDFDQIVPATSWHRRMKPLVHWALRDRFMRPPLLLRPFQVTKLLRSAAKRVHEIQGFLSAKS